MAAKLNTYQIEKLGYKFKQFAALYNMAISRYKVLLTRNHTEEDVKAYKAKIGMRSRDLDNYIEGFNDASCAEIWLTYNREEDDQGCGYFTCTGLVIPGMNKTIFTEEAQNA